MSSLLLLTCWTKSCALQTVPHYYVSSHACCALREACKIITIAHMVGTASFGRLNDEYKWNSTCFLCLPA
ncbi:hypothetical protein Scep_026495 [Stephania cephalantha]|uniref:Secreted protein n=1 Tax=Stephania cephalantha TaxID=152367 RepID=A0AAP0HSL0_9MAGN